MGKKLTFKCDQCGYEALISGGKDRGFSLYTCTYVCSDCNSLVDLPEVLIHKNRKKSNPKNKVDAKENTKNADTWGFLEDIPEEDHDFFRMAFGASQCEHTSVKIWDTSKKKCPRCDGKMKESAGGGTIHWD